MVRDLSGDDPAVNDRDPLPIRPWQRELVWGGSRLAERYGKPPSARPVGESWECWDENAVAEGERSGETIAQLRRTLGRALTGAADPAEVFPLLTKIIDARGALSVQVHPGDAYAQRVEHQPVGKTECWYVLEAEPGASIVLGWARNTSRAEYESLVHDGKLDPLLRHVPARAGDVFHLPAGTLHAIGAGIVIYETQQPSDLTYRIYDYDRPGPGGKPRELHVAKAADVLDFARSERGAIRTLDFRLDGLARTLLVSDPKFWVEKITVDDEPRGLDLEEMPLSIFALNRPIDVSVRGAAVHLEPYRTALVPAAADVAMLRGDPGATLLAAAPPRRPDSVAKRLGRAGIEVGAVTDFLAQF